MWIISFLLLVKSVTTYDFSYSLSLTNCISVQLFHHGFTIQFIYFCKVNGKSIGDTEPAKAKSTGNTEPAKAKAKAKATKPAGKEVAEKENELSVSLLNIQVGLIRKAWKHPSADRYFGKPTKESYD